MRSSDFKKFLEKNTLTYTKGTVEKNWGRKINCVMRRFFPSSSVGDRPAPRGCTSTPDERKVTTI